MFQSILYRTGLAVASAVALVACLVSCLVSLEAMGVAQEERPQIITGERKAQRKKDTGPRAVAVLRVSADGKRSLVPIAILINGKFWDASAYKANPVPMALDSGTVYEAESTGNSQGLFTVGAALHSNAVNAQTPWLGTGAWVPAGTEKPSATQKASIVPVGIDNSDAPPRLTKNPQKQTSSAPSSGTPSNSGGQASSSAPASNAPSQPSNGASPTSDEPPRLKKSDTSQPDSNQTGTNQAGSSQPSQGQSGQSQPSANSTTAPPADGSKSGTVVAADTKPAETKSGDAKSKAADHPGDHPADHHQVPQSDSGTAEANRPRLRRGRPAQSFADEEFPGYSKPGATASAKDAKAAEADKGPVQLIPAISDAGGPDPHPFTFEWLKDEEPERRQQMTALAQQQIRAYVEAQAKAQTTQTAAKVAPKAQMARHVQTSKPPEPILSNVQMTTYDLWTSNQPIIVLRADAVLPPTAGWQETTNTGSEYSILLVARTDIYTNLRTLYSGVTDKYHLDLTPRLDLIDAVDADGDGRGELLFKETSDAGTGWVIYRATADKLWKMYDSLNPE